MPLTPPQSPDKIGIYDDLSYVSTVRGNTCKVTLCTSVKELCVELLGFFMDDTDDLPAEASSNWLTWQDTTHFSVLRYALSAPRARTCFDTASCDAVVALRSFIASVRCGSSWLASSSDKELQREYWLDVIRQLRILLLQHGVSTLRRDHEITATVDHHTSLCVKLGCINALSALDRCFPGCLKMCDPLVHYPQSTVTPSEDLMQQFLTAIILDSVLDGFKHRGTHIHCECLQTFWKTIFQLPLQVWSTIVAVFRLLLKETADAHSNPLTSLPSDVIDLAALLPKISSSSVDVDLSIWTFMKHLPIMDASNVPTVSEPTRTVVEKFLDELMTKSLKRCSTFASSAAGSFLILRLRQFCEIIHRLGGLQSSPAVLLSLLESCLKQQQHLFSGSAGVALASSADKWFVLVQRLTSSPIVLDEIACEYLLVLFSLSVQLKACNIYSAEHNRAIIRRVWLKLSSKSFVETLWQTDVGLFKLFTLMFVLLRSASDLQDTASEFFKLLTNKNLTSRMALLSRSDANLDLQQARAMFLRGTAVAVRLLLEKSSSFASDYAKLLADAFLSISSTHASNATLHKAQLAEQIGLLAELLKTAPPKTLLPLLSLPFKAYLETISISDTTAFQQLLDLVDQLARKITEMAQRNDRIETQLLGCLDLKIISCVWLQYLRDLSAEKLPKANCDIVQQLLRTLVGLLNLALTFSRVCSTFRLSAATIFADVVFDQRIAHCYFVPFLASVMSSAALCAFIRDVCVTERKLKSPLEFDARILSRWLQAILKCDDDIDCSLIQLTNLLPKLDNFASYFHIAAVSEHSSVTAACDELFSQMRRARPVADIAAVRFLSDVWQEPLKQWNCKPITSFSDNCVCLSFTVLAKFVRHCSHLAFSADPKLISLLPIIMDRFLSPSVANNEVYAETTLYLLCDLLYGLKQLSVQSNKTLQRYVKELFKLYLPKCKITVGANFRSHPFASGLSDSLWENPTNEAVEFRRFIVCDFFAENLRVAPIVSFYADLLDETKCVNVLRSELQCLLPSLIKARLTQGLQNNYCLKLTQIVDRFAKFERRVGSNCAEAIIKRTCSQMFGNCSRPQPALMLDMLRLTQRFSEINPCFEQTPPELVADCIRLFESVSGKGTAKDLWSAYASVQHECR